jgi:hypothetical protein
MATISQNAEKELINDLLDFEFFTPPRIQRRLAYYAYASESEKKNIICDLMESFWSAHIKVEIFPIFEEFDTFLVACGKRGHFVHQFEVFLLGLHLIRSILRKVGVKTKPFLFSEPDHIFFTWLITATAHDFGQPLETASKIAEKLGNLYESLGMSDLSNEYRNLPKKNLLQHEHKLRFIRLPEDGNEDLEKFVRVDVLISDCIKNSLGISREDANQITEGLSKEDNHGYVSSAVLYRSAIRFLTQTKTFKEVKASWLFTVLRTAIGAIAVHNLHKCKKEEIAENFKKIGFTSNPFAYLLFLLDNIQDWSRPSLSHKDWPVYNLASFSSSDSTVKLDYCLTHDDWTDAIINNVKDSLSEKKQHLQGVKGPRPRVGIDLRVSFESNEGTKFTNIDIGL